MTITHSSTRLVALAAGVAVAVALAFGAFATVPAQAAGLTSAQVQSILSLLQSFGADQATINNVNAALTGQATPGTTGGGGTGACPALTRDLSLGSTGADVQALQQFFNSDVNTQVASAGAGSPGNESTYFGSLTQAAAKKFQAANGVTPVAGYVGPITRAAIAAVCGTGTGTGTGTGGVVIPTGPGVTVSATAQPSNALAPLGATRVPFTNFTITNNTAAAVVVNSVTIQRTGLGVDSNFSGAVLVDSNGLQIGTAKTLNSNHQANLDGFTLNPGASMTYTVAGNISSTATGNNGQVVSLQVVAVNTTAPVTGSLPIVGASHTINTTLTLGSVSTTTSSFDPGAAQSKNLGDTDVRVSGLRFTAGSAEDLRLYSVRWRQVGTASASDISNVRSIVDGTSYPATVSADGKYYTTLFPGGLLIAKGNSIDLYNMADLTGTNSAARTVDLDIDKVTDVYFVGQTYGYGVAPSGTYTPWFSGYVTTINAGTPTTIGKATEVPAQNIAPSVPNQVLGGFVTDFKGEAVSTNSIPITIATSSDMGGVITSISIVDENGVVVAGPVDEASTCTTGCTVTFTDTVTFPTGRHVYTIKGKIPSGTSNNSTVIVSMNPSSWGSPTGQTSGNTITISTGNFAMNTMTVKAAALVVSLSTTPSSQNVVGGSQGVLLANLQLDASQSGEDVRISSVPIIITVTAMTVGELTSCQIYDGSTALNTGSNVPTLAASGSATTYTFDNTLTIPKGTVKTLGLKCNIASSVTASTDSLVTTISNSAANWSATGVTSGVSITETFGNVTGGTMTIQAGSVTLTVDSSSPSFSLAAAGTSGVTMAVLKLRAANEALSLSDLGLQLGNGTYSANSTGSGGSPGTGGNGDLTSVYIYDGATLVGTMVFTGNSTSATSTLNSVVSLPKDTDKLLTVKGDLANIGTSYPGGIGNTIKIDPQGARTTGAQSGTTVWAAGATTGVAGVQIFKSYPTLALDTLASTGVADGRLMRFKVTANSAGPVGIATFSFKVSSTTGVTITSVNLKAYTDSSYSQPISGQGTGGLIGSQVNNITSGTAFYVAPTTNPVAIPAGSTIYFELTAAVSGVDTGDSVVTTLLGDSAAATTLTSGFDVGTSTKAANSSTAGQVAATAANFIWAGNSTTTSAFGAAKDVDWTNGYSVPGLPAAGLIQTRSN